MATKPFTVDGDIVVDEATLSNSTNSLVLPSGSIITGGGAVLDATNSDTDDLTEGVTNLYYTDTRADARIALQAGSNLDLSGKSTTDLSEGTNLYYTQGRFDTAFTAKSTTDLSEGTNLYFTDARTRAAVSAAIGSAGYNSSTGVFSIPANTSQVSESVNLYYTNARADARITAASITDLSDADQSVQTTDDVTFANITTSGYLRGPASFVIDPAAFNDDTGTVVIAGNLQVDGTQTTINSTTVAIDDLKLSVATDAADSAAANGAGITVGGANANITYTHATTSWDFDKPVNVAGNLGVTGTVDGVDIAARNGVLTSTTTTANAAMPKTGGTFTGDVTFSDNEYAKFGTDEDVQIGHNGNGLINNYTNDLYITNYANDRDVLIQSDNSMGGTLVYFRADGSTGNVDLFHYGNARLSTTSGGVDVTGNIVVSGTVDGVDIATRDAVLTSTTTTAGAALPKAGGTMTGDLSFGDNDKAIFGAELEIYSDATHARIREYGSGQFKIQGDNMQLLTSDGASTYLEGNASTSAVTLYHASNAPRLATTATGIDVTGIVTASGNITAGSSTAGVVTVGSANGFVIQKSGVNGYINQSDSGPIIIRMGSSYSEKIRIDSSGNVGIGTTNPTGKLEVYDAAPAANTSVVIHNNSASHAAMFKARGERASANQDVSQFLTDNSGKTIANIRGVTDADTTSGRLEFWTAPSASNAVARMTVDSAGNVGIGTTDPAANLHLHGDGDMIRLTSTNDGSGGAQMDMLHFSPTTANEDIMGLINMGGYYTGTTSSYFSSIRTIATDAANRHGRIEFLTRDDATFTTKMTIDHLGNVGIGTTQPILGAKFEVVGTTVMDKLIIGSGFVPSTSEDEHIINFIVGSTTTANLNGFKFYENTGGFGMSIGYNGTGNGTGNKLVMQAEGGLEIFHLYNSTSGDLRLGTSQYNVMHTNYSGTFAGTILWSNTTASTSPTTGAIRITGGLGVGGDIHCAADVTTFSSSDQRLKTNVQPIENSLDKVKSLTGYTFNWNELAENKPQDQREAGVFAQDVEAVLPEVTTTRDDGYKAVRYEKMVPMLIEAIKELSDKVDAQQQEIERLRKWH